ncbi:MAG: class I SAM-dependent methyltransferase [Candidatus Kariarchaeaceae archaeon]
MEDLPKGLAESGAIEVVQILRKISGGKVLDVATQKGGFIDVLIKALKDYDNFIGIDIEFEDLESIKKEYENKPVKFLEMNAEDMEFEDDSFDTVSLSHSLHHLSNIDKALEEIKRVLKPGGTFIVQEPFCDGEQSEAQKVDILQSHWDSEIDTLLGIFHNNTFSKKKIKEIFHKLEFKNGNAYESTHYVKCLFCDDKFQCDDPKNKDIINFALKEVDQDIKRLETETVKDHPDAIRLKEEGEKIKKRIREIGVSSASNLYFIGKT